MKRSGPMTWTGGMKHMGRLAAVLIALTGASASVVAQHVKSAHKERAPIELPPPSPPATPAPPPESKPYDPQLLRLSEMLGALTYLRNLCGAKDADAWRGRMQGLLEAEGTLPVRKDRLAGAYNQGLRGYQMFYRSCTPNAHLVIERFLAESNRIARDLENRYRAS